MFLLQRMKQLTFTILIAFLLGQIDRSSSSVAGKLQKREIRLLPSNDFEDGTIEPWMDYSTDDTVQWRIEDAQNPTSEVYNPAPKPINGGHRFLRVNRDPFYLTSGMAVLYSQIFTLVPGEAARITFSFWIRSKRPQGNNLQVNGVDQVTTYSNVLFFKNCYFYFIVVLDG